MNKQIAMALIVTGAITAFYGCAELQLSTSEYKRLNQNELERLFQVDRNAEFSSSTTRVSVKYFSDGRQECTWDSGNDKGTYRINNDEFCSTWTWLRKGAESCSEIYKISDTEFEFRSSDGTPHAVMRLK